MYSYNDFERLFLRYKLGGIPAGVSIEKFCMSNQVYYRTKPFFFVRDFYDMRCKYDKVLSIIHQQLNREPEDGDVFIVMSKDLRLVRLFSYDRRSYSMFEKRFRPGYQFMQATYNGAESILPYYECRQ